VNRWPIAGARPVDRARDVARTCWEALHRVDPDAANLIAQSAAEVGEQWLTPQIARHDLDDLVSVSEAAELAGRSVRWTYEWVAGDRDHRAVLGPDRRIQVRVRDVLEAAAGERRVSRSESAA
jgi:hypothetical protein